MYSPVTSLKLNTNDVSFNYVLNNYMKSSLTLTNVTNKQVAFKVLF